MCNFAQGPITASLGGACAGCLCSSASGVQERIYMDTFVGPDGGYWGPGAEAGRRGAVRRYRTARQQRGGGTLLGIAECPHIDTPVCQLSKIESI